jgi:hypothetical protein
MNPDTKQLRMMRKKARVSLDAMAKEMGWSVADVRALENLPPRIGVGDLEVSVYPKEWADRYVEALTRLTA